MYRRFFRELEQWENDNTKEPLLVTGARQVGKTWLIKSFCEQTYDDYVYLNLEEQPAVASLFEGDLAIVPANTFSLIRTIPTALTFIYRHCADISVSRLTVTLGNRFEPFPDRADVFVRFGIIAHVFPAADIRTIFLCL